MTEHEVQALLVKHRTEMHTIQTSMDTALDQIKVWQSQPDQPPDAVQLQQHREVVLTGYTRLRILQGEYEAVLGIFQRRMMRHESSKDAYQSGWDDRFIDIAARATGEEYAALRRLLDQIDAEDSLPY